MSREWYMVNYETLRGIIKFSGSEPSLEAGLRPNSAKLAIIPGILRVYLENTGHFADFSDFCHILPQKSW